ncbi:MAG TPA: oligosaccharide flippase family protein [Paludibacter sp.]
MRKSSFQSIKSKISNNTKVIENYFFMTALQIINSLFGILIYPYLIRVLGAESYGLYVFALSVTSYFIGLISFGFSFPALKAIIENKDNQQVKNEIVSSVFTAKSYLAIISTIIFSVLLFTIPIMHDNWIIFGICFTQIIAEVLFPVWYFQGVQKMRIVTFIQLGFRILSLPFIFLFIKTSSDCWIYVLIATLSVISGGISSILFLKTKENITIRFVSIQSLKIYFRDAMPFFWSSSTGTIKQESVTIIIGAFFGMRDVALYDLANKIIILPRMLTMSINGALFPKIIENVQKTVVHKILRYETLIGFGVIAGVALFGRWIILILGGTAMLGSYPLAVILSVTVLVWLVVGCYISFVFVPTNRYYFVTRNQFVAFGSFFLFCIPGIFIFHNILVVVVALTLSGLSEIAYCNYLIKKHKLL